VKHRFISIAFRAAREGVRVSSAVELSPQDLTPVALTERGQRWLRDRLAARIEELAEVASRLAHVAEDDASERRSDDTEDADRARYEVLVADLDELTAALRAAVSLDDVDSDPSIVELGDEVEIELPDGSRERWRIVHPLEAPMADGRIAVTSPVARAVLGRRVGDRAVVTTGIGVYGCSVVAIRRPS
jgi:transcription elongation factor GreA